MDRTSEEQAEKIASIEARIDELEKELNESNEKLKIYCKFCGTIHDDIRPKINTRDA